MTDYTDKSKKEKSETSKEAPSKQIEKVVKGEVVIKKKGLGQKFKETFIAVDVPSVAQYVTYEVLIPAARNLIYDVLSKGAERLMFGESSARRRMSTWANGPTKYNYQRHSDPIHRHPREQTMRYAPTPAPGPRSPRYSQNEFILEDRDEADLVLERMHDILDEYQVLTMADLLELLGERTSHTDHKWGWISLTGAHVRQIREGYLLEIPPAEPVQ
jgi:hypothetical protein